MNKYLQFVIGILMAGEMILNAPARGFDRGETSFLYEMPADFKDTAGGKAENFETTFKTGVPLKFGDDYRIMSGLGLRWNHFNFSGRSVDELDVYSVRVPFTYFKKIDQQWGLQLGITPGLATDFKQIDGDDLVWGGRALVSYQWPGLQVVGGVVVGQEFGTTRAFPALGAMWDIDEFWHLRLIFPNPKISYTPSENWAWFASLKPTGEEWSVEENGQDYELILEDLRIISGIERRISKQVWLQVAAGANFNHSFEVSKGRDVLLDAEVEDTFLFKIGIVMR